LTSVPNDVRQFIINNINSVEQLEILLLLNSSKRAWSAAELANSICTTVESCEKRLESLKRAGVLVQVGTNPATFQYQAQSSELDATVIRLAREYQDRRISIINFIYSQPIQNIRTISDAFRIRPDKDKE
jgi:hypothetical protein